MEKDESYVVTMDITTIHVVNAQGVTNTNEYSLNAEKK